MGIVAAVNGENIDDKTLELAIRRYIVQLEEEDEEGFELSDANLKYVKTEVLNYLIERRILLQKARQDGITVPEKEVQSRVNAIRAGFESDKDWEDNLLALGTDQDKLYLDIEEDILLEKQQEKLWGEQLSFSDEDLEHYFHEHESQMKEPDLYTFHEIYVNGSTGLNEAAYILHNKSDLSELKKDFAARNMEFQHYTDIPASRLPEEIYNVVSDLEIGKIGTMMAGGEQLIVYQLIKKITGKKFEFKDIKHRLKEYLILQGRAEIKSRMVQEEMEKADIRYLDLSTLDPRHKKG